MAQSVASSVRKRPALKKSSSGKKHQNAVKNTVLSTLQRQLLFLGHTVWGRQDDYGLFKSEFRVPLGRELGWFARCQVWLDLG